MKISSFDLGHIPARIRKRIAYVNRFAPIRMQNGVAKIHQLRKDIRKSVRKLPLIIKVLAIAQPRVPLDDLVELY